MDEALIEQITGDLLKSYDLDEDERARLPSQGAIVNVVNEVRRILFPGYYAEQVLPQASRRHYVGTWLCQAFTQLSKVIRRALSHADPDLAKSEARRRAEATSTAFLTQLPALREQLRLDAEAALAGDPAAQSVAQVILTYPGFLAITIHRIAHWLYTHGVPFVPRVMSEYAHAETGIDIHPGARIGESFFIDHGTGVVIGETTVIGQWVKIYQGVTLGALSVSRDYAGTKRHPTIEDRVVLYAGATVLGGDTIVGEEAIIGGNVWLTQSVQARTTVLETPKDLDIRHHLSSPGGD
ncbi:MAG: serine O-acetyltransferase EpsC [Myxococcota bacterium]|nr:serine O-acetyltransferase EpsC [Myxococcota bacterium]